MSAIATANIRPPAAPCASIRTENLRAALAIACEELRRREARLSPAYCSALRAGFEANLSAIRKGQRLEVRD